MAFIIKNGTTNYALFACVTCGLCVLSLHYNYGVLSITEAFIRKCSDIELSYGFLGLSNCVQMSDYFWGYFVSIVSVGSFFGSFASIYLSCKFGRLKTLRLQGFGFIFAGAMVSLSNNKSIMLAGRFLLGVFGGIAQNAAYLFATEISTPQNRGSIGALVSLIGDFGKIMALVLSLLLNDYYLWRLLFSVVVVISAVQLGFLCFLKDTPKFLLMYKKDLFLAKKSLKKIMPLKDLDKELESIQAQNIDNLKIESSQSKAIKILFSNTYRRRLFIVLFVLCSQGFSGLTAISYYSQAVLGKYFDPSLTSISIVGSDLFGIGSSLVIMFYIDKIGRRLFLIGSQLGAAFACVLLLVGNLFKIKNLLVGGVFFFKISYGFGLAGVPHVLASELFPAYLLAGGNGLVLAACSLSHFTVGSTFQILSFYLKDYVFLVFVVSNLVFAVVSFVFIPETKRKSIEEIQALFSAPKTINSG